MESAVSNRIDSAAGYSLSPIFCIFPGVFAALGVPALVVGAQSVAAASQIDGDASVCKEEGAALFVIGLLWLSVAVCSASFFLAVSLPTHTPGVWTYRAHFALALAELAAFFVTMVLTIKELQDVFTSRGLCSLESSEGKGLLVCLCLSFALLSMCCLAKMYKPRSRSLTPLQPVVVASGRRITTIGDLPNITDDIHGSALSRDAPDRGAGGAVVANSGRRRGESKNVQGAGSHSELPSATQHAPKHEHSASRMLDASLSGGGGVLPGVDTSAAATVQVKLEIAGTQARRRRPPIVGINASAPVAASPLAACRAASSRARGSGVDAIEKCPADKGSRDRKEEMNADEEGKSQEDRDEDEEDQEEEDEEEEDECFAGTEVPDLPLS